MAIPKLALCAVILACSLGTCAMGQCILTDCQDFDFSTCPEGSVSSLPRLCQQYCACALSGPEAYLDVLHPGFTTVQRDSQLVIASVLEESPADLAGVRSGDIVERIDGRPPFQRPCTEQVWASSHLQSTSLTLLRGGKQLNVSVRLVSVRALSDSKWRGAKSRVVAVALPAKVSEPQAKSSYAAGLRWYRGGSTLRVIAVLEGSKAESAGITPDDQIIAVNGLSSLTDQENALLFSGAGDSLSLSLRRRGGVRKVLLRAEGQSEILRRGVVGSGRSQERQSLLSLK